VGACSGGAGGEPFLLVRAAVLPGCCEEGGGVGCSRVFLSSEPAPAAVVLLV